MEKDFEQHLSPHLQKAIDELKQGEKDNVSYWDCLWGEVYGSINSDFWSGVLTEEQADYLRKKYLFEEHPEPEIQLDGMKGW